VCPLMESENAPEGGPPTRSEGCSPLEVSGVPPVHKKGVHQVQKKAFNKLAKNWFQNVFKSGSRRAADWTKLRLAGVPRAGPTTEPFFVMTSLHFSQKQVCIF